MSEQSDLDRRLRAVERALTDGDHDVAALEDAAAVVERLDALEDRIATLEERTDELDAATQAVRGYVGNVRSVNSEVEDRADAALAAVDRIEARLDAAESDDSTRSTGRPRNGARVPGDGGRPRGRDGNGDAGSLAEDGYGIEMPASGSNPAPSSNSDPRSNPPPGSNRASGANSAPANRADGDDDDDRTVIDRVREAL